jgi:hypothetical protein
MCMANPNYRYNHSSFQLHKLPTCTLFTTMHTSRWLFKDHQSWIGLHADNGSLHAARARHDITTINITSSDKRLHGSVTEYKLKKQSIYVPPHKLRTITYRDKGVTIWLPPRVYDGRVNYCKQH